MTEKEMERSIRQAFEHATPDVLGSVLDACDKQKGTVIIMKENKKRNWINKKKLSLTKQKWLEILQW